MIDSRRQLLGLLIVAVLLRAAVLWLGAADMKADPDSYARIAVTLAKTGTLGFEADSGPSPTAFRPPLYPWLLSWLVFDGQVARGAVAVLHWVLGCATVVLTYWIGCKLNLKGAWLAAGAVIADPILLRQSQLVMTETLAVFLAVLVWYLSLIVWPSTETSEASPRTGKQWLALCALGLALGISILARPTAAPWALLITLIALAIGGKPWKRRVADCLVIGVGVLFCVVPWMLRNEWLLGKPIWATTHGGYTLLLANNPPLYRHFAANGPSRAWEAEEFQDAWSARLSLEVPRLHEVAEDRLAYQAARGTITRYPEMFAISCLYRMAWLWALWPYDGSFGIREAFIGGWYAIVFCGAYYGLLSIRRARRYRGWLVGLSLVVTLTAVHAVYWSNMRMRAPAMPCVMLLAVAGMKRSGAGS